MSLIHGQARIDSFRLVDWLLAVFLHFFGWVLAGLIEDKGALVFESLNISFEDLLVFLVSVKQAHGSLKVLCTLLVSVDHDLLVELPLLL